MRTRNKTIKPRKWTADEAISRIKQLIEDDEYTWSIVRLKDDSCIEDNFPYAVVKIKVYEEDEPYPTWDYDEFFEFLSEEDKNEFVEFMESQRVAA